MKELIQVLEAAQSNYGKSYHLTIHHLLNIVKLAEKMKTQNAEKQATLEETQHLEIMEEIYPLGQD